GRANLAAAIAVTKLIAPTIILRNAHNLRMRILGQRFKHGLRDDLGYLGMRRAELLRVTVALRIEREVIGVIVEIFIWRQQLRVRMNEQSVVIDSAAEFFTDRGMRRVCAIPQRPVRIKRHAIKRIAEPEFGNISTAYRANGKRWTLRQLDRVS